VPVQVLLRPVGYWTARPGDGLPDPKTLMSSKWEKGRRKDIAMYLMNAAIIDEDNELHECRICGLAAGYRDRTDGVWRWPEGLAHYVTAHGVQIPPELVASMAKRDFKPPQVDIDTLKSQLPPTNPQATSLISKGSVAAVLDEMLSEKMPSSPRKKPKKPTSEPVLEDVTDAIPVQQKWVAQVQGVPTLPNKIQFDRPVVLGRDRTCDVVLQHASISRRHVRLVPWQDRVIVQDLGSSNGVWVRGRRQDGQVELKEGEQFQLGQATITLARS
jgi:hypothetical protein